MLRKSIGSLALLTLVSSVVGLHAAQSETCTGARTTATVSSSVVTVSNRKYTAHD
jgi:hypothetical protein